MQPTLADPTRASLKELLQLQAQAADLHISPNQRSTSPMAGAYRSAFRGRGMEYDETRLYLPGDDIRAMDWRVTARTDKPHTKVFREERERPVMLAIDTSTSMQFGTRVAFKSAIAAQAAALLGWGAALAGDRVGFLLFAEEQHTEWKPQKGKNGLLVGLKALTQLTPQTSQPFSQNAGADLAKVLHRLNRTAKHGHLIYIISDFLQWNSDVQSQVQRIALGNELALIQVLDALEMQLPSSGKYWISNRAGNLQLDASDPKTQASHQQLFPRIAQTLTEFSRKHGVHYCRLMTSDPVAKTLRTGLFTKRRVHK